MKRLVQRWLRRPWLSILLLTALLGHALIPMGFMPGPGGLILCSGYAPLPAIQGAGHAMDMSGMDMSGMDKIVRPQHPGSPHNSPDHRSMAVCPFAAAAVLLAMSHVAATTLLPEPSSTVAVFPPEQSLPPRGTIVPTRLPRGPPGNA